jgi:hypothetical protein
LYKSVKLETVLQFETFRATFLKENNPDRRTEEKTPCCYGGGIACFLKVCLQSPTHISEFVPYGMNRIDPICACRAVWHLANMSDCVTH